MKLVSLILSAVALLVGASNAATVSVGRGIGNPGVTAQLANGTALTGGGYYFAVGTFTNSEGSTQIPAVTDLASFQAAIAAFDVFSSTTTATTGVTAGTLTGTLAGLGGADTSVFNNRPMYFLVGNGSTFANSTQFAIFSMATPTAFPTNVQNSDTVPVTISGGAVITPLSGAGTVNGNNLQLVLVPEPSAALLGLLGVVGLIRRRR